LLKMRPQSSGNLLANYIYACGIADRICLWLRWLHHKYCRAPADCEIDNSIGLIPDPASTGKLSFKQSPAGINRRGLRAKPVEAI
jgi:hypothetical protein